MSNASAVFVSKSGRVYSDEDLDALAESFERTAEVGGDWIVRPVGRPEGRRNDLVSITVKLPSAARDELDAAAGEAGQTRSQLVRRLLEEGLRSLGRSAAAL